MFAQNIVQNYGDSCNNNDRSITITRRHWLTNKLCLAIQKLN